MHTLLPTRHPPWLPLSEIYEEGSGNCETSDGDYEDYDSFIEAEQSGDETNAVSPGLSSNTSTAASAASASASASVAGGGEGGGGAGTRGVLVDRQRKVIVGLTPKQRAELRKLGENGVGMTEERQGEIQTALQTLMGSAGHGTGPA